MTEPDFSIIQGNPIVGFNTHLQLILGFALPQSATIEPVRPLMLHLAQTVTSAAEVTANRTVMRNDTLNVNSSWLSAGISEQLVRRLQPEVRFRSRAFNAGFFRRRDGVMGDRTDPDTWKIGGTPEQEPDLLFIVAANAETALNSGRDQLVSAVEAAGFLNVYEELGQRLEGEKEHFGFRDGIAQPKPGEDATMFGQFVTGYERIRGNVTEALFMSTDADLSHNATFGVFRRLRQDVGAFRSFVKTQTQALSTQWPSLSEDHLAALIVGRWPDGQLVDIATPTAPIGASKEDIDNFDFGSDPLGDGCPVGAHIRKVNPRKGPPDVTKPELHSFLRRGIPYGTTLPSDAEDDGIDRGLLFLAFQASIDEGVDFVTSQWMNSDTRPGNSNDLLVGRDFRSSDGGRLDLRRNGSIEKVYTPTNDWVIPTGGAYLFFPSLRGFERLAEPPKGAIGWRLRGTLRASALLLRDMAQSLPGH